MALPTFPALYPFPQTSVITEVKAKGPTGRLPIQLYYTVSDTWVQT